MIAPLGPGVGTPHPRALVPLWPRPETDIDRTLAIVEHVPPNVVSVDDCCPRRDRAGEQASHVVGIDTAFHGGCHLCIVIKLALRAPANAQMPEGPAAVKGMNPLTATDPSGRPVVAGRGTPRLEVRFREQGTIRGRPPRDPSRDGSCRAVCRGWSAKRRHRVRCTCAYRRRRS